ncbi:MAG TPA: glycerate kinase [Burkholderiaceae bacterium]|nr:glycerate kinase [Burkholderiaceae bacterium]
MSPVVQQWRVVVAPDSFKESLSAARVAEAIALGVKQAAPSAQVICVPMADGGEGSLDAVLAATRGERRHDRVQNANGRPCQASWGWLEGETAFIEMAEAAGLERIAPAERRALHASTYGVGELVLKALDAGARRIVLGLGGSATTDGGAGLFQALGARLLDDQGNDLPPGGAALNQLAHLELAGLDPRLNDVQFEIAVDVDNPLCGERGAAAIFGPQKGASPDDVRTLDQGLTRFARICRDVSGRDEADTPGTGAAGGLGFVIKTFFSATFRPGVELIAELAGLEQALKGAHLVFTGEGRMDRQTLLGKTPAGVARYAKKQGAAVIALAGSLGDGYEALYEVGITAAFSVVSGPMTLEQACRDAARLLQERARDSMVLWANGR